NGTNWQRATIVPNGDHTSAPWSMWYSLSGFAADNETRVDPSGQYTYTMRVADRSGNIFTSSPVQVRIDQDAPELTLDTPSNINATNVITQPIVIGGALAEPGPIQTGIQSAEIAFTPQQVTRVLSNHLLLLGLDDPLFATSFHD